MSLIPMRLEERVVLDGAAVDTAVQVEQAQDVVSPASVTQPAPAQSQVETDNDEHVLVISDAISEADKLAAAVKDNVHVVTYDADADSTVDILDKIRDSLDGRSADSIALATHGLSAGHLELTDTLDVDVTTLLSTPELVDFFDSLGALTEEYGRIDLLGCNVGLGDEGAELIDKLEDITGKNIAASEDLTGNPDDGGDWQLESDGIDVDDVYFDGDELGELDEVLGTNERIPGMFNGNIYALSSVGDTIYFAAQEGIWKYENGSVAKIASAGCINEAISVSSEKGVLFSLTDQNTSKNNIYYINGQTGTVELVTQFDALFSNGYRNVVTSISESNGNFYFNASSEASGCAKELWTTNGTLDGTRCIASSFEDHVQGLMSIGDKTYFTAKDGIWEYSCTGNLTRILHREGIISAQGAHNDSSAVFAVLDVDAGKNDIYHISSSGNITLLKSFDAVWGAAGYQSIIHNISEANGNFYFNSNTRAAHESNELWVSNGSASGTRCISSSLSGTLFEIISVENKTYFADRNGVWSYSDSGSLRKIINSGYINDAKAIAGQNGVFFTFTDDITDKNNVYYIHSDTDEKLLVASFDSRQGAAGDLNVITSITETRGIFYYNTNSEGEPIPNELWSYDSNIKPVVDGLSHTAASDKNVFRPFSTTNISDRNNDNLRVLVALSTFNYGDISLNSLNQSGFIKTANGAYEFSGTPDDCQIALRKLVFEPEENKKAPGSTATVSFQISVQDKRAISTASKDVQITYENDAPILNKPGPYDINFTEVVVGESNNGETIKSLFSAYISDPNKLAKGIAVTNVDDKGKGQWEFSLDGGVTWNIFSPYSDSKATLLAADELTRIRFLAKETWSYDEKPGISFFGWDQYTGVNGEEGVDISVRGSQTAFSLQWHSAWVDLDRERIDSDSEQTSYSSVVPEDDAYYSLYSFGIDENFEFKKNSSTVFEIEGVEAIYVDNQLIKADRTTGTPLIRLGVESHQQIQNMRITLPELAQYNAPDRDVKTTVEISTKIQTIDSISGDKRVINFGKTTLDSTFDKTQNDLFHAQFKRAYLVGTTTSSFSIGIGSQAPLPEDFGLNVVKGVVSGAGALDLNFTQIQKSAETQKAIKSLNNICSYAFTSAMAEGLSIINKMDGKFNGIGNPILNGNVLNKANLDLKNLDKKMFPFFKAAAEEAQRLHKVNIDPNVLKNWSKYSTKERFYHYNKFISALGDGLQGLNVLGIAEDTVNGKFDESKWLSLADYGLGKVLSSKAAAGTLSRGAAIAGSLAGAAGLAIAAVDIGLAGMESSFDLKGSQELLNLNNELKGYIEASYNAQARYALLTAQKLDNPNLSAEEISQIKEQGKADFYKQNKGYLELAYASIDRVKNNSTYRQTFGDNFVTFHNSFAPLQTAAGSGILKAGQTFEDAVDKIYFDMVSAKRDYFQ